MSAKGSPPKLGRNVAKIRVKKSPKIRADKLAGPVKLLIFGEGRFCGKTID
jgi:hypothetical protein